MRSLVILLASVAALYGGHATAQNFPAQKSGKYVVELRLPAEGLFAEEEVDIEFRVMDSTKNDPIQGMAGVNGLKPEATVTMPSMPGMPEAKPSTHAEGVPGDYGLVAFFPHGGDYQIDLRIAPVGEAPFKVSFKVDVKDAEARKGKPSVKPYSVELIGFPKGAKAGEAVPLRLAVRDTKTKQIVRDFDVAHTKQFHLIIVSKDLGYFMHEHPEQQADGTWALDWTFPAGGEYTVFGDVAPKGRGSQVLATKFKLAGPAPNWDTSLKPTGPRAQSSGVSVAFEPLQKPIPVGKMTQLSFKLTDAASGKPITDLEPYLGAYGHLMIIGQDGTTFVHSHPMEDESAIAQSKGGTVVFNARLPKAGRYKAFAQFQRAGNVITVPFVFEVKG
jgi:hypothetical protein